MLNKSQALLWITIFLLLSPELSLSLFPLFDGGLLLLIILFFFQKIKRKYYNVFFFLLLSLSIIVGLQYIFPNSNSFEVNVRREEFRTLSTFGIYPAKSLLDITFIIKCFAKFYLSFLLICSLNKFNGNVVLRAYKYIVLCYLGIQFLFYKLGIYEQVTRLLFSQKELVHSSENLLHFREGVPRFEAGFSEPSFLVGMTLLFYYYNRKVSLRVHDFFFITSLYLFTQSTSVILLVFAIFATRAKTNIKKIIAISIVALNFIFYSDFFKFIIEKYGVTASMLFRFLKIFKLEDFKGLNIFIGQGLFEIYTQPPITNIFLQTGILGILFLMIFKSSKFSWPEVIIIVNCLLLIAPHLYFLGNILMLMIFLFPRENQYFLK